MKKSYIVLLLCFMCLCTSLMSCGKNTDTKTEVEIETGVYIGNSGDEHEYEINPNAARHAYNLDFFVKADDGVTYEGDENVMIRKGVDGIEGNVDLNIQFIQN